MHKKIILIVGLIFTATIIQAQNINESIKKANNLIEDKKYNSAYAELDKADPNNKNMEVILLKENILLNYFVTSIAHQMFALTDIDKNDDILNYRGTDGNFDLKMLDIPKLLDSLIKVYPDECRLYKGLGDYYIEVQMKYPGNWLKSDKELFTLAETNFTKAIAGNCADYESYHAMGYLNIANNKFKEAIPYFLKSIELKPDYASAHYNLAYAYLYNNEQAKALVYAKNAIPLYNDKSYKADAARMVAQIYTELADDSSALIYYHISDSIQAKNYYTYLGMLESSLRLKSKEAHAYTVNLFELDPRNPTIYGAINDAYINYGALNELLNFYNEQLVKYANEDTIAGSIYFYLGIIYLDLDKAIAKADFLKAKELLLKVFDKNHQVFTAIEQGLKMAEQ
mgnify:FL=1